MSVSKKYYIGAGDAGGRALPRAGFGVMVAPLLVVFERWEGLVIRFDSHPRLQTRPRRPGPWAPAS